ncbi:hypothetical protein FJT64_021977 [Amphibalanus amphitrite]|uniref:RNase H type-1 domain-containing protein n=1 Tax=Amphibalanus amphitrite TaxID=1232801 RepID=A0A6A4WK91_AMPAM|nr:hypothetical protein FJT64_021977 [Amphibalanus amphitrite]
MKHPVHQIGLRVRAALLAEADLPALTVRAKELAATEASRIARLPAEDRAKQLLERDPRPRLKYRAHEAWKRACAQAAEEGRPEPALPDEDALLPHKPCIRRVGQWTLREAGVSDCPAEPFLRVSPEPPWSTHQGSVTFIVDLPTTTRRTDPPDKRREAAERALAALPAPDCSIWSDGSAAGGTSNGGGGAAIILHRENDRRIECLAAAGTHCSSTRAELVAVREALKSLASLPADSLDAIKEIRLCTDSRASYAHMRSRLWGGPLPSLGHVLGGSATLIFEYLRRVGRVDPPVDAATAVAAPAATA